MLLSWLTLFLKVSPLPSWDGENHSAVPVHKSDSQNVPLLQMQREDLKLPLNRTSFCFTIVLYNSASRHCRAVLVLFDGPAVALHVPLQAASLVALLLCLGISLNVLLLVWRREWWFLTVPCSFIGQSWHKLLPTHFLIVRGKKITLSRIFFSSGMHFFSFCMTVGIVRT